jgi:aspartate carbamoyltransferase catalytic subunit
MADSVVFNSATGDDTPAPRCGVQFASRAAPFPTKEATAIATEPLSETLVMPTRTSLFHVIDPRVFERPLLDELCSLATRARLLAKTDSGARMLRDLLPTRRAMLYFTQPSTRTFLSFNNACHILGMRTSEIRDPSTSSEVKGESFEDSIRTFSSYVDVIVMRTKESGRAAQAARLMNGIPRPVPVINAGSGSDQHPTQALLDIYTLQRSFEDVGGIDGKVIGMMGDLRRGRTVRSLCYLMKNYANVRLVFVAPEQFAMEPDVKAYLDEHRIPYAETTRLADALPALDAIYVTRMQTEWDTAAGESRSVDLSQFSIGAEELARLKADAIIMHPLPRGSEIEPSVDQDPRAMYWRQERNGMWMRVAVLIKIFGAENRIAEIELS